ncbi:MAG: nucleotidyltransferase family protein [Clostridia bacterium]|nr:nucleotidyltransferase family protein [Clostridia bacterium]
MEEAALRDRVTGVIRSALWGEKPPSAGPEVYAELREQALSLLAAAILPEMDVPDDLRRAWQTENYAQVMYGVRLRRVQERLPLSVPYAILKGSAAAQYYPRPDLRTMGDIDLITRREDFDTACGDLLKDGYAENTVPEADGVIRHRRFLKDGIEVEMHAYYAVLNDPDAAGCLDDLIIGGISPSHLLPDMINGLVLLEHISRHLEDGLGLRQIIDWMMFVHRCLPDARWPEFSAMADRVGLSRLAVITTRMCGIYLGLPARAWCADADEQICGRLMDYLMACGNFGQKLSREELRSETLMLAMWTPKSMFSLLQRHGLYNWKAAQRHRALRPFAWIYQIGRYLVKGLGRPHALSRIRAEHRAAREHNDLLDALGAKQRHRGISVVRNGRYEKI